jgi:carboxyl-terminal processing protease
MRPERFRALQAQNKGEFGGIGTEIRIENGLTKVISALDDTPAARADLRPGDLIVQIDGKPLQGLTLEQVVALLRGPPKTPVTVAVQRKGMERPLEFNLIREVIRPVAVKGRLENDVIYLKISPFSEQTQPALLTAVGDLKKAAGDRLKGYVLDVRGNTGGLLDSAIAIADDFLESGTIVSIKGRTSAASQQRQAKPGDIADAKPMVVLVNNGTAAGAEIVAAALQENKRAVLIGNRTFGRGAIQTIFPMNELGALRVTTSYFYTPSGREFETVGVPPDIVIDQDAAGQGRDAPLEAALSRLRTNRAK